MYQATVNAPDKGLTCRQSLPFKNKPVMAPDKGLTDRQSLPLKKYIQFRNGEEWDRELILHCEEWDRELILHHQLDVMSSRHGLA